MFVFGAERLYSVCAGADTMYLLLIVVHSLTCGPQGYSTYPTVGLAHNIGLSGVVIVSYNLVPELQPISASLVIFSASELWHLIF